MFENKYRVVHDDFTRYEAQVKFWWFPLIWFQLSHNGRTLGVNSNLSVNGAINLINRYHQYHQCKYKRDKSLWQGSGNDALQQIDYNKE